MVAPDNAGDVDFSMVRVTGSGYGPSKTPVFLDLSNVSSMAAAVPLNYRSTAVMSGQRSLGQNSRPGIIGNNFRTVPRLQENNGKIQSQQQLTHRPAAAQSRSAPRRVIIVKAQQAGGRSRVMITMPRSAAALNSAISSTQPSVRQRPHVPETVVDLTSAIALTRASVSQLTEERNELQRMNQELQKHVERFRQIFRSKDRLKTEVKRLGVKML